MRISILVLAAAVSLAACGVPGSAADPTSSTSPPASTTTPVGVIDLDPDDLRLAIVPGDDGGFSSDLMVGCNGSSFPVSALDEIVLIPEEDPNGYLAALEPFLTSGEGQFWPQDGWQLLWSDEQTAHLINKTREGDLAWMILESSDDGWRWGGSSIAGDPCHLRVGVPDRFNTVDWRLDPAQPSEPESREIHLILNERECVGGQEIGDRLRGPQVVMTADEVRIVFVAERPPGDAFTCQGNPDTPYLLELPEPIGDRAIVDGLELDVILDDHID